MIEKKLCLYQIAWAAAAFPNSSSNAGISSDRARQFERELSSSCHRLPADLRLDRAQFNEIASVVDRARTIYGKTRKIAIEQLEEIRSQIDYY